MRSELLKIITNLERATDFEIKDVQVQRNPEWIRPEKQAGRLQANGDPQPFLLIPICSKQSRFDRSAQLQ